MAKRTAARLESWLRRLSPRRVVGMSLLAILGVGYLDMVTGYEATLSVFYLVFVLLGAWGAGRAAGLFLCGFAVATELFADIASGVLSSSPAIQIWNASTYLLVFGTLVWVLTALRAALDRERRLARHDDLTGLANRTAFFEFTQAEVARSQRYGHGLTLAFIDCDHFKDLNDHKGHEAGDACLKSVASALEGSIRSTDLAARLGGDEFALVFPELESSGAREVIEKIRARLSEAMDRDGFGVTFSIGVVSDGQPGAVDRMLNRADALMYEVKRSGRDAVRFGAQALEASIEAA